MSTIRKKGVRLLVGLLAVLVFLTGCGKAAVQQGSQTEAQTTAAESTAAESTAAASAEKKLDPYNIIWYQYDGKVPKDVAIVAEEISKYLKEKINATLTMNVLASSDYNTKMPVIVASGEKFDMCFTASWGFIYQQNALKGAFVNLTKEGLLEKYGADILNTIDPILIEGSKINGDLYAVPVNKEAAYQWGLTFNKKYVDKYNLDITKIKKLSDAEPLLKVVKENEPDVTPFDITSTANLTKTLPFDFLASGNLPGAIYLDGSTTKVFNQYEKPEMKEFFQTMHSFYKAGYIPKDVATLTTSTGNQTGKWLMQAISYTPYAELTKSANVGYDILFQPLQDPIIAGTAGTGAMQAISVTSGDKERTMMFLNMLYSDEKLLNMVDYGIEGVHYVKVSENIIDDPPGVTPQTRTYSPQTWTVGNQFLTYLRPTDKPDKWEKYKEFNNSAIRAPSVGFSFDGTNVSNQIAQINNVLKEYFVALATGSVNPDEYLPKFLDKLKSAGTDELIDEIQRQFDEFLTSKGKK